MRRPRPYELVAAGIPLAWFGYVMVLILTHRF